MTVRKALAIGSLILLLTFLSSSLRVFDARQQAIELEGNRLQRAEAFGVVGNAHSVLSQVGAAADDLRVVKSLTENGRVRAVVAEDGARLNLPVHVGRTFAADDEGTALAGADVALTWRGDRAFYTFDGREYEVVGRLGLRADSLLAEDVVLNDPSLFDAEGDEPLVVDGRGALRAYVAAFGSDGVVAVPGGTSRRTNVDVVSPLLLLFGNCVVVVGLVLAGVLANALVRRHSHVQHLLGRTHLRIFAATMTWVLSLSLGTAMASAAFWALRAGGAAPSGAALSTAVAWQVGAVVVAFAAAFVSTARREVRWS